jgi:hypothetical protein
VTDPVAAGYRAAVRVQVVVFAVAHGQVGSEVLAYFPEYPGQVFDHAAGQ